MSFRLFARNRSHVARAATIVILAMSLASSALMTLTSSPAGASTPWDKTTILDGDQVTMVYDGSSYVYVADAGPFNVGGGRYVYKYDTSGTLVGTVDTGVDSNPASMVISRGYLYVALMGTAGTGAIEKINLSNFTATKTQTPTGVSPTSISADGNGNLWINTGITSNTLLEINPTNFVTMATVTVSACQGWMSSVAASSSSVWATCGLDNKVIRFDLSGLPNPTVTTVDFSSYVYPNFITVVGSYVYVGASLIGGQTGALVKYNLSDGSWVSALTTTAVGGVSGATFDGSDVWLAATSSSESVKVNASGTVLDAVDNTGNGAVGILPLGDKVWQATVGGLYIFSPGTAQAAAITVQSSPPTDATVGSGFFPMATSTSGDTVVVSVDPASVGVCYAQFFEGMWGVGYIGAGTCTLYFDDAGNGSSYTAAPQQTQSFIIVGPGAPAAPAAPTDISAVAGDQSATVSWTNPPSNGDDTAYNEVQYSTDGTNWITVSYTISPTDTSYTFNGLSNGTSYYFQVIAHDGGNNPSTPATTVDAVTPEPCTPATPTDISAVAGNQSATVSWTNPPSNGDDTVFNQVQYSTDGINWRAASALSPSATTYTVTGLVNGTGYYFRVIALDGAGNPSIADTTVDTVTPEPATPAAPTGISAVAGNQSVTVSWTNPPSNGDDTVYNEVQYSTDGTTWTTASYSISATDTSYSVTGLTSGTGYYFRVIAFDVFFNPSAADATEVTVTPQLPSTPAAPAGIRAVAGNQSATVSWTNPSSNGDDAAYNEVQYSTDGTTWTTASATISASATSYSVTGLTNNTTYYFRVMAKDANGALSTPNTTSVAVVPQTVLVVSEYSGALSNDAYSIAADPTGNVYVFESNCSVYEIPVSNPSTQTLLPGTDSNWCGSGRSYWVQMTFANLGGTPALVFMSYNDGHVYRYNLPSTAAPVVVGNDGNDPWGLSYDASSDTLYLGNYGAGSTTSAVQEITSFSSCAGSCTSQDIPGIPASIWYYANAPFVSGGTLYLASYQGVQSIVLPSQANPHPSWSLPTDLSACAGGGYGSSYPDQIAADAAGNIFFTCNYGKQLVEMRHGSTTLSVVPTSGTAFARYTPRGLAYSQGSLYAISNLRHVVQISLPDAPVTPPVAQKPSAPIHLSTAAKGALVTLRWNAPRFPGSQPITSYTVRISGSSRTWVVSGRTWVNLIAGLNPKKYYTISIAATNSVGTGPAAILRHVKG